MKKNVKFCFVLTVFLLGFFQAQADIWTGTKLDWELSDSVLTISGNGEMPNYQTYDTIIMKNEIPWYSDRNSIASIKIESGVTNIGNWIFSGYPNLTSVSIPSTVTNIGKRAFAGCVKLNSINIPGGVTSIEADVFAGCSALTSVTIPESVTSISLRAFKGCSSIKSITLPKNVTAIGDSAFHGCSITSFINQRPTPQTISGNVFDINHSGDTLYVPSSAAVTAYNKDSIWMKHFDTIKISVASVALNITSRNLLTDDTIRLAATILPNDASNKKLIWSTSDSTVATVDSTGLVTADSTHEGRATITVKTELGGLTATCVVNVAKSNDATLKNLIVRKTWNNISLITFNPNTSNYTVKVDDSISKITIEAAANYKKAKVQVANNPTGDSVSCNLESDYGDNPFEITVTAENGDKKTYKVTVHRAEPAGTFGNNLTWALSTNGTLIISGKNKMKDFELGEKSPWHSYLQMIKTVTIKDGVTSIGNLAFYGCDSLASVTIPNSVTSIGMWAFYRCKLSSVIIPQNVTDIDRGAFFECKGLTFVINQNPTPQDIRNKNVFEGCRALDSLTLYVPSGRVEAYTVSHDSVWNKFGSILIPIEKIKLDKTSLNLHVGDTIRLIATVSPEDEREDERWISSDSTVASVDSAGLITANSAGTACIKFKFETNDGNKTDSCRVTVIKDSNDNTKLSTLTVDSGTLEPRFNANTNVYTVKVDGSISNITIGATKYDTTSTTIVTGIGDHPLDYGINIFPVTVTAGENNKRTYTVTVTRDSPEGDFGLDDDNSNPLHWHLANGTLTISGKGSMDFFSDTANVPLNKDTLWYKYRNSIKKIVIEEEVADIGNYIFYRHDSVKSVIISGYGTIIGYGAFIDCKSLNSINLPDDLQQIHKNTFSGCSSLTSVTIPWDVKTISEEAFSGCSGLTSIINLNPEPQDIQDKDVFKGVFSSSSDSILLYVPSGCVEAYTTDHDSVWSRLPFKISVAVTEVGLDASSVHLFTDQTIRLTPTVSPEDASNKKLIWSSNNNNIATVDSTGLVKANSNKEGNATITVTTENGGFTDVCTVTVAKNSDATLRNIRVNKGKLNPEFGPDILYYTDTVGTDEDSITIIAEKNYPKATVERGDSITYALDHGENSIPVTVIAEKGNRQVYTVNVTRTIPTGTCGDSVSALTWEYYRGTLTIRGTGRMRDFQFAGEVGWNKYRHSIDTIVIEERVENIGNFAFRGDSVLTAVTIPQSVTNIGSYAFADCPNLTSVAIPGNVTGIGYDAFKGCSSLTSVINLSPDPQSIGEDVFEGVPLEDIELYVSSGCVNVYRQAEIWSKFGSILVLIDSIKLNTTSAELQVGDTIQLIATVWPEDANETVTAGGGLNWNSSNEAVATVSSSGLVTAKSRGPAVITVTAAGRFIDSCKVFAGGWTDIPLTGRAASVPVYLNRQILYVDTPEAEQINIYSVTGTLLYRLEKPAGKASFVINRLSTRILIVKGSSGWTGKLIFDN